MEWIATNGASTRPLVDERICNPVTGIVDHLIETLPEPDDPRVFHFIAKLADTQRFSGACTPPFTSGVGLTRDRGVYAAVGEALERYCATHYLDVPLLLGRYDELEDEAVEPGAFALFGEHQFGPDGQLLTPSLPEDLPTTDSQRLAIGRMLREVRPVAFSRQTPVRWAWMLDLTTGRRVLAPAALVFLGYIPSESECYIWQSISTGLACSRSSIAAVLAGLLEVIERDAVIITWANRLSHPRIRLDPDPFLCQVFNDRFCAPGLRYHLFHISLDLPAVTVLGILEDERRGSCCVAAASRTDARQAVLKVLLELAQARIGWKREHVLGSGVIFRSDFLDVYDFRDHSLLYLDPTMTRHLEFLLNSSEEVDVDKLSPLALPSGGDGLRRLVSELAAKGLRVLAADLTTADVASLGYTVVRVLVPGLQELNFAHAWPFQGGRRLYEVPWKLGYRSNIGTPADLNPLPHPMS